jgi:2-oxoglutarate dehydrogenase E1 component
MHGGQDRRGMRKPLVIFTPKSILRHPKAVSSMHDLTSGSFREVLGDSTIRDAERVGRVVLANGKIYYELLHAREEREIGQVAIVRIEQVYPFPQSEVKDVLLRYPITAEVVWAQEEPRNMGAWRFIQEHVQPLLDPTRRLLRYVGRQESASAAPGSLKRHQQEQADILEAAFAAEAVVRRKVRVVARRKAK